jgi:hypothetical protein
MKKLRKKYLRWVESPQGEAPYFYRRYPEDIGRALRQKGMDDKVQKRLPVPLDATDQEITDALVQANRVFNAQCKEYDNAIFIKSSGERDLLSGASRRRMTCYLITNPEFKGWVKCGETSGKSDQRAKSMNTSSPADYEVERSIKLPDGWSDKDMHPFLEGVAGGRKREWFFMPVDVAEQVVRHVLNGNQDAIDRMPKCEPPSVLTTVRNSFRDIFKAKPQQQREVLYDADYLAFS